MVRSKKSEVWLNFIKTRQGGQCKLCNKEVKTAGNTTNLRNHLKRRHSSQGSISNEVIDIDIAAETAIEPGSFSDSSDQGSSSSRKRQLKTPTPTPTTALFSPSDSVHVQRQSRQSRIDASFSEITSFQGGDKSEKLCNAIIFMIVKDNLPLNTTDKVGFQYFAKLAVPHFNIPNRSTITERIEQKYDTLFRTIKQRMTQVQHFSITTDAWTDTLNSQSYLGVTLHYIFEGKLRNLTISLEQLNDRHTGEYLAEEIKKALDAWDIPLDKIVAAVTDNGSNIVKAIQIVVDTGKHLPCFAHTLDLIPQKVCDSEVTRPLIQAVKSITRFFKQSNIASDELRKIQQSANTQSSLRLIQSVATRWNSTFCIIERFITLSDMVGVILLRLPDAPPMLTAPEMQTLKEIILVLKPIESTSRELEGEDYVTCSKIIPAVYGLRKIISKIVPSTIIGQQMKTAVLTDLQKRFGQVEDMSILSISTLLDPRFKRMYFEKPLALSQAILKVDNLVKSMISAEKREATDEQKEDSRENNNSIKTNCGSIWQFHAELLKQSSNTKEDEGITSELKHYLHQNPLDMKTDPVNFWYSQKEMYPYLSQIALQYFTVPATSAPSERLFSKAGRILEPTRSRLTPNKLSHLVFMNSLDISDWKGLL